MKFEHHPDEATLVAYAAGTLDEAFAVLVSCHLEVCPQCREVVRAAEEIGGAAMTRDDETAEIAEGSFGRLLEKISAGEKASASPGTGEVEAPAAHDWHALPQALRGYLDVDLADIRWNRVAPGIWQKPIPLSADANSSLRLLRIAPGKAVPEHGHGGQELTLILSGAYEDRFGHFGAGDVADLDDDVEHQPMVVSEQDCICLAATEAPTRFKQITSRLLQPFIGI